MRILPLLIPLLCACGPSEPRTGGASADRPGLLRVVSWNVHDLFDERPGPGETAAVSAALVEARLDAVAVVLLRLDADLVLLQEVEDLPLLRRLAARTGHGEAWLLPGNDPRGIEVALLSRWTVTGYRGRAGERGADGRPLWPRDAVVARVAVGGARVTLVGTHLSSHLSDPTGERRLLQAGRLRELADEEAGADPGALLLVGGDLNDGADAAALQPLFGDGRWLDGAGVDPSGSGPATDPAWTWSDGRLHEPLDHLALRAAQRRALVTGWVAGGPDVEAASDHRPVVLDLRGW
jgi:endonuclease/exonuclease/phosphatase family metal-dependent hydrolase